MAAIACAALAATGSTGNNNHASVELGPETSQLAVAFIVEAVGATPAVTFKLQATFDRAKDVADGAVAWFDLLLIPADSDTGAVGSTVTAVGQYARYLAQAHSRFVRRVRLVTSSNTNVTYRAHLHAVNSR